MWCDLLHCLNASVRGSLPSGLERLDALISANARHLGALSPRRHQDRIIALANAVGRSHGPQERAVLLHGDLHAGNLLLGSNNELVVIDPTPALGEPEQDIGDAPRKMTGAKICPRELNSWPKPATLTPQRRRLTLVSRLGTAASSTPPQEPSRQEEWTRTNCSSTRPPSPGL
jgi:hypothetical protein